MSRLGSKPTQIEIYFLRRKYPAAISPAPASVQVAGSGVPAGGGPEAEAVPDRSTSSPTGVGEPARLLTTKVSVFPPALQLAPHEKLKGVVDANPLPLMPRLTPFRRTSTSELSAAKEPINAAVVVSRSVIEVRTEELAHEVGPRRCGLT